MKAKLKGSPSAFGTYYPVQVSLILNLNRLLKLLISLLGCFLPLDWLNTLDQGKQRARKSRKTVRVVDLQDECREALFLRFAWSLNKIFLTGICNMPYVPYIPYSILTVLLKRWSWDVLEINSLDMFRVSECGKMMLRLELPRWKFGGYESYNYEHV